MVQKELRVKLFDLRLEQQKLKQKYTSAGIEDEEKKKIYKRMKEIDTEIEKIKHAYGRHQINSKIEGSRGK